MAHTIGTIAVFGLPTGRTLTYEGFPEGLIKPDFSQDDFGKVHVHTPEGNVLTYIVNMDEKDGVAVITPNILLQEVAISIDLLAVNVLRWGMVRGIIGDNAKATLLTQLAKTQEELDETIEAATMYLDAKHAQGLGHASPETEKALLALRDEVVDGIGDQAVTLILAADLLGVSFAECLHYAYEEIKNRKGKMVDGQFVKESK